MHSRTLSWGLHLGHVFSKASLVFPKKIPKPQIGRSAASGTSRIHFLELRKLGAQIAALSLHFPNAFDDFASESCFLEDVIDAYMITAFSWALFWGLCPNHVISTGE